MTREHELNSLFASLYRDFSPPLYAMPDDVVICSGKNTRLFSVDGREFLDYSSAYSAVNQGHCHPAIFEALQEQASRLTCTSQAFMNNVTPQFLKKACRAFGYDKIIMANTGVEAVETALKTARLWGQEIKKVPKNQGVIVTCQGGFHGRTITVISFSNDPTVKDGFGPYTPGFVSIPYNDISALEEVLQNENVIAFLVEPIQGEAGIIVPDDYYLNQAFTLCQNSNVLLITDCIQCGLGRAGKMLAAEYNGIKADIVIIGKALSGGMFPVSAVLTFDGIAKHLKTGMHGSTFAASPMAATVASAALDVIINENLCSNSVERGQQMRDGLRAIESSLITRIAGKGLMNAIDLDPERVPQLEFLARLRANGILAMKTHKSIRLCPPLTCTADEIEQGICMIKKTIRSFE